MTQRAKSILMFFIIEAIIASACYAQEWAITYGGSGLDRGYCIQQTSDGGYIVAGTTRWFAPAPIDCWIMKLDANGTVEWQKAYGGDQLDDARSIEQTDDDGDGDKDDGYIVAGQTKSFGANDNDFWVLKLKPDGSIQWQKRYGGNGPDEASSVRQTFDENGNPDGYIVAGYTHSLGAYLRDVWIVKLNLDGTIDWQKTYGRDAADQADCIQQTFGEDGQPDGYIVSGFTYSLIAGSADLWVSKLNVDGSLDWQKKYDGGIASDRGYSVKQTFDESGGPDGYIVAGYTYIVGASSPDAWVLRLASDGSVVWAKTYGGDDYDEMYSIEQTQDGGYAMAGLTRSFGGDAWILKLNSSGTIIWQKTYGGDSAAAAYSIEQSQDGGYIVTGYIASFGAGSDDLWVLKLNLDGEIPNCAVMASSDATVVDSSATVGNTYAVQTASGVADNTSVSPRDTAADKFIVCGAPEFVCEGDFEPDGDVDGSDLAAFAADFGKTDCSGDCAGDFDRDGDVDGSDLAQFAADFGRTDCPVSP